MEAVAKSQVFPSIAKGMHTGSDSALWHNPDMMMLIFNQKWAGEAHKFSLGT